METTINERVMMRLQLACLKARRASKRVMSSAAMLDCKKIYLYLSAEVAQQISEALEFQKNKHSQHKVQQTQNLPCPYRSLVQWPAYTMAF